MDLEERTEELLRSLKIEGGLKESIGSSHVSVESDDEVIEACFGDSQEAFNSGIEFVLDLIRNGWVDPENLR